jgi:3-oxoacyl-[acyl-carrier-protein] synthase-1
VICGAGSGIDVLWKACLEGSQSGIKTVKALSGKEFHVGHIDDKQLPHAAARYDERIIRIEDAALKQIDSEIEAACRKYGKNRIAVCAGQCDNGTELSFAGHSMFVQHGSFPEGYCFEMQGADYPASYISEKYGVTGPSLSFSTACSSSAGAVIKAAELLRSGLADAVIAGGVDITSDTVLLGFDSLEAVSSDITDPFSANRHGITLGEGAAYFVMTKDAPEGIPASEASRIRRNGRCVSYDIT